MSGRQTQPVVLRRGVRFRHGSLFRHQASGRVNSSSAARAFCGIGIVAYVATFLVNIFHLFFIISGGYKREISENLPLSVWLVLCARELLTLPKTTSSVSHTFIYLWRAATESTPRCHLLLRLTHECDISTIFSNFRNILVVTRLSRP